MSVDAFAVSINDDAKVSLYQLAQTVLNIILFLMTSADYLGCLNQYPHNIQVSSFLQYCIKILLLISFGKKAQKNQLYSTGGL